VRTLGIDPDTTLTSRSSGKTEEAQRPSRRGFSGDHLLRLKSSDLANKTTLLRAALASQNQPRRFGADSFQPPSAEERLLDLSSSNLARTILSELSTYAGRLNFLNLSSNNLSGAISIELGRLAESSELDLSVNPLLTGLFPRNSFTTEYVLHETHRHYMSTCKEPGFVWIVLPKNLLAI
jgi:hypothetical protein